MSEEKNQLEKIRNIEQIQQKRKQSINNIPSLTEFSFVKLSTKRKYL